MAILSQSAAADQIWRFFPTGSSLITSKAASADRLAAAMYRNGYALQQGPSNVTFTQLAPLMAEDATPDQIERLRVIFFDMNQAGYGAISLIGPPRSLMPTTQPGRAAVVTPSADGSAPPSAAAQPSKVNDFLNTLFGGVSQGVNAYYGNKAAIQNAKFAQQDANKQFQNQMFLQSQQDTSSRTILLAAVGVIGFGALAYILISRKKGK